MNTSQLLALLNQKVSRTERKNERLKVLLYNAIVLLEENNVENLLEELGMTKKEYDEIMEG